MTMHPSPDARSGSPGRRRPATRLQARASGRGWPGTRERSGAPAVGSTGVRLVLAAGLALAGGIALLVARRRRALAAGIPFAEIRRSVAIAAPGADPYAALSDPERLTALLEGASVEDLGGGRWRWRFDGPAGIVIPVETEIVDARPGRRIAWRAGADTPMPHEDAYDILPAPGGGTIVQGTVSLYPPPMLPLALVRRPLEQQADRQLAALLSRLRDDLDGGAIPGAAGDATGGSRP